MNNQKIKKKCLMFSLLRVISVVVGVFFIIITMLSNIKIENKKLAVKKIEITNNQFKLCRYPASEVKRIISNSNNSSNIKKQEDLVDSNRSNKVIPKDKKIAFLTIDDGPSVTVTPKVLDVLKEKNVKATFFLIGKSVEDNEVSKNLLKRIYKEGHSIGNHTYTHNLKTLYPNNKLNIQTYMNEVEKTNEVFKKILGNNFSTRITRMPGGYMSRKYYNDPNLKEFDNVLNQKGMYSIDWNALSGDAQGKRKNKNELLQFLKNSISNKKQIVILIHDTYGRESSAEALPVMIDYLKLQGYEFKTIE